MSPLRFASNPDSDEKTLLACISAKSVHGATENHSVTLEPFSCHCTEFTHCEDGNVT